MGLFSKDDPSVKEAKAEVAAAKADLKLAQSSPDYARFEAAHHRHMDAEDKLRRARGQ